jgi:hypothetical protein
VAQVPVVGTISVAVQRNWVKIKMQVLLNGEKNSTDKQLKNTQVCIATSKLLIAI